MWKMKINIKFWAAVIIISLAVIAFRNINFSLNKKHLVSRSYTANSAVEVKHPLVNSLGVTTIYSDSLVCSYSVEGLNDSVDNCTIRYYGLQDLQPAGVHRFPMPKSAQLKYAAGAQVYYIDRFNLYEYDLLNGRLRKLHGPDFKCLNVARTDGSSLVLFGERATGQKFVSGYYALHLQNGSLTLSKQLEENAQTYAAENSLIYSGKFTRLDAGTTSYYCDKYSKIFFFDNAGRYVRELETQDRAPKPELVSNGQAFFYKRGSTFNVNNGIHREGDKLLVFSCRSEPVKDIIIDLYSLQSGSYLYSTRLHHNDWNCPDIISVSNAGKNAIVNFQDGVALFDFSSLGK